jgi:uncharacterized membrane protein YbhN (UPF0104 family)
MDAGPGDVVTRPPGGRTRRVSVRTALHWVVFAAALGYLAYQVPPLLRAAHAEAGHVGDLHWGWAVAGALLGLAAVAAYGELHRDLLAVGGAHVPGGTVQSITFAQNAIGNTIPVVGGAAGIGYAISRFTRRGADPALASWATLLAGLLTTLSLVALAAAALGATGRLPLLPCLLAVAAVCGGAVALWTAGTHPTVLRAVLLPAFRLSRFIPGQCAVCREHRAADVVGLTDRISTRLSLLRPSRWQWARLLGISVLTWVLDFGDLAASSAAALDRLPWPALVWGFVIVQGSIALQVLPGGAGLAEVGLLGALLAAGAPAGPAAATVLLYRAGSWLLPCLVGWVVYGVQIHLLHARPHRHGLSPAAATG